MLYKYLQLILFSTLVLQASPKVFDSLGNELESFQGDCKGYQEISSLPEKIKKQCNVFNSKVNNAFKVGYKLNPDADGDISEKKLNTYLSLLRELEEKKENILNLMYSEAKKARKQGNTEYYSQLIENHILRLYSSDYEFMKKNQALFSNNERYTSHIRHLKSLEESRKPIGVKKQTKVTAVKKKKISPPKKNNYFITSIKKIEIYEKNTDADPLNDDVEIYIVFGNSKGEDVRPPNGMELDYSLTINKLDDSFGHKERVGQKLASSNGKLISERGFTSIFIKMPEITTSTRIITHTQVALPNGTILKNIDRDSFTP